MPKKKTKAFALVFFFYIILQILQILVAGGFKMKELLIGMSLGFMVGAIMVRNNKGFAEKVEQGMEKQQKCLQYH